MHKNTQNLDGGGRLGKYIRQPPHNSTKFPSYVINNGQQFTSISVVLLVIVGSNMFSIFTCASFRTVGGRGGEGERVMSGVMVGGQGGTLTHQARPYFFEAQITR